MYRRNREKQKFLFMDFFFTQESICLGYMRFSARFPVCNHIQVLRFKCVFKQGGELNVHKR